MRRLEACVGDVDSMTTRDILGRIWI